MTMHLVGPYLSMTGKRKKKQKFRSAEEARRSRELEADWNKLKSKWSAPVTAPKKSSGVVELPTMGRPVIRDTGPKPQSLSSWNVGAVTSKQNQQYTGDKIVGIGTLHKSNAVPIFSDQEAIDIAHMRR